MGAHQLSYISALEFTAAKVKFYTIYIDPQEDAFLNFSGCFPHGPTGFALVVSLRAEKKTNGPETEAEVLQPCVLSCYCNWPGGPGQLGPG